MVKLHNLVDTIDSIVKPDSFNLPTLKENSLRIFYNPNESVQTVYNGNEPLLPFANSDVFHASILQSRRLTGFGDCKAVYEVTFDIEGSDFSFKAGDTIGVIPHNSESEVNFIVTHLDLASKADQSYSLSIDGNIKGSKLPAHVPVKSTVRHILTYCLDLRSVLKKLFLLALSKYTKDERERKILEYLCSKEGASAYTTHILNQGLCILDIFTIFQTCKPPIEILLANLPRLVPRPYSIVNSSLKNNKTVTICFSVMTVNNRKGLTTGWLENLVAEKDNIENQIKNLSLTNEGSCEKIPIYVRKNMSMFSLPENLEDLKKSLILIGPGTGVAPFIGFLEEREIVKENNPEIILGEVWLFFGCRNPKLDFIYEDELNSFLCKGILNKLVTSFSRIEDTETKYIQDALILNAKEIIKLINDDATIYLCGDLKTMAVQVKEVLVKCFIEHENMSHEEAEAKMSEMQKNKQYLVDAWS